MGICGRILNKITNDLEECSAFERGEINILPSLKGVCKTRLYFWLRNLDTKREIRTIIN